MSITHVYYLILEGRDNTKNTEATATIRENLFSVYTQSWWWAIWKRATFFRLCITNRGHRGQLSVNLADGYTSFESRADILTCAVIKSFTLVRWLYMESVIEIYKHYAFSQQHSPNLKYTVYIRAAIASRNFVTPKLSAVSKYLPDIDGCVSSLERYGSINNFTRSAAMTKFTSYYRLRFSWIKFLSWGGVDYILSVLLLYH